MIQIVDPSVFASNVMPGLDPGISRGTRSPTDGRVKPGHNNIVRVNLDHGRIVYICHYTTPRSRS
jgi:hypothetical protein